MNIKTEMVEMMVVRISTLEMYRNYMSSMLAVGDGFPVGVVGKCVGEVADACFHGDEASIKKLFKDGNTPLLLGTKAMENFDLIRYHKIVVLDRNGNEFCVVEDEDIMF